MPIVFLIRHPCAVAMSKVKLRWGIDLPAFLRQPKLMADHLSPFASEIEGAATPFEKHMVAWCVETLVPFSMLYKGDVYLVFYENLCLDPEGELRKLFAYLGRPFDNSVLRRLHRPSATSRTAGDASPIMRGQQVIDDWRRHISSDELYASKRITSKFGLEQLYGDSSTPDLKVAESLLSKPAMRTV
jgi:hypothetical protein